jgi:YggT family protein
LYNNLMVSILIFIISTVARLLIILVIVQVVLSFVLPPYNNFRRLLDRIIDPFLNPIRRIVPPLQNIDFSPLILVILVQVIEFLLVRLLLLFG